MGAVGQNHMRRPLPGVILTTYASAYTSAMAGRRFDSGYRATR